MDLATPSAPGPQEEVARMSPAGPRTPPRLRRLCRLAAGLATAGLLAAGCDCLSASLRDYEAMAPANPPALASAPRPAPAPHLPPAPPAVQTVAYKRPAADAPPPPPADAAPAPLPPLLPPAAPKAVTVGLLDVLRLTQAQNTQIALARKRVEEAQIAADQACNHGHTGCRAGGCADADDDGDAADSGGGAGLRGLVFGHHTAAKCVAARARLWQRRGELARTTTETLQDAGSTYIDLLTARRGEAVGKELETYQLDLLRRAEDLQKTDQSATVLVEGIRSELSGRRQALDRLRQQGDAAAAKLVYLLNLPPGTPLLPADASLEPIDLVDVSRPVGELVAQAQANGPGVRELQGLIDTIREGLAQATGLKALLPGVAKQVCLAENRLEQAQISYQDLQGKLALGVQESYSAILSGREQIREGTEQIRHAVETYRISDLRMKENVANSSMNEVLQAIRGLELAHFGYLSAVRDYDKAEVRLLLLLGRGPGGACGPVGH
jgi:outer membrane protein TolC